MFRLLVNIGGIFDVFVSKKAPESLRTAMLPTLTVTGRVGSIFVERLRFGEGIDYGRNRYLLLLTSAAMTEVERRHLVGSLEEAVGARFDRLIEAVNRDEVSEDLRGIFAACARADEQDDWPEGFPKAHQDGEGSQAAVTAESQVHQSEQPREVRTSDDSRDSEQPEDTTGKIGHRDGEGPLPSRAVWLGAVVAINLLFAGLVFGSMAWYLERSIGRGSPAEGLDGLQRRVTELSTKLDDLESSVEKVAKTVNASLTQLPDLSTKLDDLEGSVGEVVETVNASLTQLPNLSAQLGYLKGSVRQLLTTVDPSLKKNGEISTGPKGVEDPVGQVVKKIQTILKGLKYYSGKVDGLFGSNTAAAIREWQLDNGESSTGKLDWETIKGILESEPSATSHAEGRQGDAGP
ncbi:MAG: peptidoglycan-binding domain-containing protein [Deltaproteobacteria bacterium]|nr:peptidoglycan-binding domain-containing protein [Deltaproteobacteria bacterium]